jgi:hypothetical protein
VTFVVHGICITETKKKALQMKVFLVVWGTIVSELSVNLSYNHIIFLEVVHSTWNPRWNRPQRLLLICCNDVFHKIMYLGRDALTMSLTSFMYYLSSVTFLLFTTRFIFKAIVSSHKFIMTTGSRFYGFSFCHSCVFASSDF